jgi:hypothetical protein
MGPPGKPELAVLQLAPPSVLLDTPMGVGAYTVSEFRGSITRLLAWPVNPVFAQLSAPSVLLYTFNCVDAYTVPGFCGSIAKA